MCILYLHIRTCNVYARDKFDSHTNKLKDKHVDTINMQVIIIIIIIINFITDN